MPRGCATPGCDGPGGEGVTRLFCADHAAFYARIRAELASRPDGKPEGAEGGDI